MHIDNRERDDERAAAQKPAMGSLDEGMPDYSMV